MNTVSLLSAGQPAAALGETVPAAYIGQETSCTGSQQKNKLHQAPQPAGGGCAASSAGQWWQGCGGRAEGAAGAQAARSDVCPPILVPGHSLGSARAPAQWAECQPAKPGSYTCRAIHQQGVWAPAAVSWGLRQPSLWSRLCLESCSDLLKIKARGELRRLQWPKSEFRHTYHQRLCNTGSWAECFAKWFCCFPA